MVAQSRIINLAILEAQVFLLGRLAAFIENVFGETSLTQETIHGVMTVIVSLINADQVSNLPSTPLTSEVDDCFQQELDVRAATQGLLSTPLVL